MSHSRDDLELDELKRGLSPIRNGESYTRLFHALVDLFLIIRIVQLARLFNSNFVRFHFEVFCFRYVEDDDFGK